MFHKLENLWKIEYKVVTKEPFITQAVSEELKREIEHFIDKDIPKTSLDAVPLILEDHAVITGNTVKGVFRHIISAQLTQAGHEVCVQDVKLEKGEKPPEGRREQCKPNNPCFVCKWFGTASRQGALYFSFLKSVKKIDEGILLDEPIPMIALRDDYKATARRAFLLIAPVKENVEFRGWIKGENLTSEILGAIKEIQDMSKNGFLQFGSFKTRGMGTVEMKITAIYEYQTVPFKLKKEYTGKDLEDFLKDVQQKYHEFLMSKT
jgi:CRISPR/Cas system CSM-associated protein Csm3 (group 7 of RAMP superfamily)